MKEIICLNGKFLPIEQAKLSVLTPGFLSGYGLFETMRAYNHKIVYLKAHLKRIKTASGLLGLKFPYSMEKIERFIDETVKLNGFSDSRVRLTLWEGLTQTEVLIIVSKYHSPCAEKYKSGLRLIVSSLRQDENSFLARIKTTSRILYELSFQDARQRNFDEAIILNHRGYIAEASRSNIFFVKENELWTPALTCGCLEGITRRLIIGLSKKYKIGINEGNWTIGDLSEADEAFLTNSLIGVMPIASLENRLIGSRRKRVLTSFFMRKYHSLLK